MSMQRGGTVVDGEESDDDLQETIALASDDFHDVSRPVHAVFAPAVTTSGSVRAGEAEDTDSSDGEAAVAGNDGGADSAATMTPPPEIVAPPPHRSPVPPLQLGGKGQRSTTPQHAAPKPAAAPTASLTPQPVQQQPQQQLVHKSPRRSFKNALDDCRAGAFDSPEPTQASAMTHPAASGFGQLADGSPSSAAAVAAGEAEEEESAPPAAGLEAHEAHDPMAFRNALATMLTRKKHAPLDAAPHALPKPYFPLKEPESSQEALARAAVRGDLSAIRHHPLCRDINDAKYAMCKAVLEATLTTASVVSSNADVHAHRISSVQATVHATTELGNVLNEAIRELCGELRLPRRSC